MPRFTRPSNKTIFKFKEEKPENYNRNKDGNLFQARYPIADNNRGFRIKKDDVMAGPVEFFSLYGDAFFPTNALPKVTNKNPDPTIQIVLLPEDWQDAEKLAKEEREVTKQAREGRVTELLLERDLMKRELLELRDRLISLENLNKPEETVVKRSRS